jgi:hypothetical protein
MRALPKSFVLAVVYSTCCLRGKLRVDAVRRCDAKSAPCSSVWHLVRIVGCNEECAIGGVIEKGAKHLKTLFIVHKGSIFRDIVPVLQVLVAT